MDASPLNLLLYLCGLCGIVFCVGEAASLSTAYYLLLLPFLFVINLALWYLYFWHGKLFLYITSGLTLIGCCIAVPQIYHLANDIKLVILYGLPMSEVQVTNSLLISMLFLFSFLLFALEFVIRGHSLMLAVGLGVLILIPVLGYDLPLIPMLLLVTYEIGFLVLNMTEKRSLRRTMKTPHRAKINTVSSLLTAAILLVSFVPAFFIEQNHETELFGAVYQADGFLKDTISKLTNFDQMGVSGGSISRGNLYQTGRDALEVTVSEIPKETLYLFNYRGSIYSDSNWSSAYEVLFNGDDDPSSYSISYGESFMNELLFSMLLSSQSTPDSFRYLTTGSSDVISEMYYLLANGTIANTKIETEEIDGTAYFKVPPDGTVYNPDAVTIYLKNLGLDYYSFSGLTMPYFSQKSDSRIGYENMFESGDNSLGYKNTFLTAEQINLSQPPILTAEQINLSQRPIDSYFPSSTEDGTIWDMNPFYEEFTNKYMEQTRKHYLYYPANTLPRLEDLCKETPLTDLDEITTYILVTLQNHAVYSTNPGTTPFNKDVLDYFLFDNGMGYCVHFASVATLMYRMYGIPARYVSGFAADPSLFSENAAPNGSTVYSATLTDHQAHAWTEIFLKDYGWVPVEVTPSLEGNMYASYPGYDTAVMNRIMKQHGWTFRKTTSESTQSTHSGTEEEETGNLWIPFLILAAIVLISASALVIRYLRFYRSIPGMNCQELFDLIIRNLRELKAFRKYTGSEEDFAQKLGQELSCMDQEKAEKLISVMLKVNYAPESPSEEDLALLRDYYRAISLEIRQRTFLLKRPLNRFFRLLS